MRQTVFIATITWLLLIFAGPTERTCASDPIVREWMVDGVKRQAMLVLPDKTSEAAPVVFGFHGHGGTMRNAASSFRMHELWPQAIVIYMQGLNTPGQLTDKDGKKPGWQRSRGDQKDRDLHFFDAVLKSIRADHKIDERRIYAMGHSNGGGFTYLLWAERSNVFAAMAPSGAAALRIRNILPPKPVMHIAGENDPLVKYAWQSMMIEAIRQSNQCDSGSPWEGSCTIYSSKIGTPVVTLITSGGHKFPSEAPPLIVRFFQQHPKLLERAN